MTKGTTNSVVRVIKITKDSELTCLENDFIHVLEGVATIDRNITQENDSIAIKTESKDLMLSKNTRVILVRTNH